MWPVRYRVRGLVAAAARPGQRLGQDSGSARTAARSGRQFGHGGGVAWYLVGGMMLLTAASTWLFVDTRVALRFRRPPQTE